MQYSNELKVGAALVIAALVAFAGVRFFQNVPLFGSSYTLYAEFENAGGLVSGNPVRMKGVKVGSVEEVRLNPETQKVRARLQLERGPTIPEGSSAQVSGISALGGVHVRVVPGPKENPPIAPGSTLPAPAEGSALKQLTDQAPALASKADSVLTGANTTIDGLNRWRQRPDSDLRRTLGSLRNVTGDLEEVSAAEKENIQQLIRNLERVSGNVEELTGDDLEQKFKAALGRTPLQEIHRAHLSLARRLLRETDDAIQDVADASGFSSPARMDIVFQRYLKITPTDYRRQFRRF